MQDRKPTYVVQPYQTTYNIMQHVAREINAAVARSQDKGDIKRANVFQSASTVMLNAYGYVSPADYHIAKSRGSVDAAYKALTAYRKSTKPKSPSIATMTKWMRDGTAKATDGCRVEPDGTCEHGKRSWLIKMGVI